MRAVLKRDPMMRRVGRNRPAIYLCAGPDCENELNEVTIKNLDPFCSTGHCKEYHEVDITLPHKGQTVASSS